MPFSFRNQLLKTFSLCSIGLVIGMSSCSSAKYQTYEDERLRLQQLAATDLSANVAEFNSYADRPASDGPFDATNNEAFLRENIPLFSSSNTDINRVYNYRWWMMSKHLRPYSDPLDGKDYWVVTEFFGDKPWASLSGAITCPAGHQFYDVRWLRDPKYLQSYAEYFMAGSASRLNQRENGNFLTYMSRPESHHFSSWMVDGVDAYLRIHPNADWMHEMLPHLEHHQAVWDSLFTVQADDAKTQGLYKILDLYDGMEFSLSAVLGLIESQGAYDLYTRDNWKEYYLGWNTTGKAAESNYAKQYSTAYRKGYPDFYLARPSVNSYAYGNLNALSTLHALDKSGGSEAQRKSEVYKQRATALQQQVMDVLWNEEDQFFNTYSAGDNAFGIRDFEARVRESVGYTPWYFNMIPEKEQAHYAKAWDLFGAAEGFAGNKGMTTAEKQHPYYNEQAYAWNGRGWPFQNSVVYKAFANYLRNYKEKITEADRQLLYHHISQLTTLHDPAKPNIGEWYIPSDGERIGGEQDYFHSTYPDIVIEDLIGFKAMHEDQFVIEPLIPAEEWDHFYLGKLRYHDHDVDIVWKKDWDEAKSGDQSMLCVWVDNKLVATSENLNSKLTVKLKK